MALETGTYISDLVASNPVASDGLGQADDHLRLLKATIKNTFAGFTTGVALTATQAQLDNAVASVAGTVTQRFPAGTAALPGITPAGDVDSGIYSSGANQLGIAVGGVAAVNVSSGGLTVTGAVNASGNVYGGSVQSVGQYIGGTGQLVPIGGALLWFEDTLPAEGGYCWANGGTLSRAAYPLLWARWGTKYGVGDGSTTFNVQNLCEVVPVGQRAMGSAASRSLLTTGVLGTSTLGVTSGSIALTTGHLPPYTPTGSVAAGTATGNAGRLPITDSGGLSSFNNTAGGASGLFTTLAAVARENLVVTSGAFTGNAQGGLSTPFSIVQPSAAVNFIIRIG